MISSLPGRQMFALADHVADIAEHEQIARDRAGQPCEIVGLAGDETGREPCRHLRRRTIRSDRIIDAPCQFVSQRDPMRAGQFDQAAREISIACGECSLDLSRDHALISPQSLRDLQIRQGRRIILRGDQFGTVLGVRPCGDQRHSADCKAELRHAEL